MKEDEKVGFGKMVTWRCSVCGWVNIGAKDKECHSCYMRKNYPKLAGGNNG